MSSSSADPELEADPSAATTAGPPPRRRARLRFLALGIALAVLLALLLFGLRGSDGGSRVPGVGDALPKISLPLLEGQGRLELPYASSPKLRGTVISFFASWCGPCRQELPMVARTARAYQGRGGPQLRFVGIDGLDRPEKAKAFLQQVGWTYPVGADTSFAVTTGTFGFQGLPETVVVNGSGDITYIKTGAISQAELRRAIDALPAAP